MGTPFDYGKSRGQLPIGGKKKEDEKNIFDKLFAPIVPPPVPIQQDVTKIPFSARDMPPPSILAPNKEAMERQRRLTAPVQEQDIQQKIQEFSRSKVFTPERVSDFLRSFRAGPPGREETEEEKFAAEERQLNLLTGASSLAGLDDPLSMVEGPAKAANLFSRLNKAVQEAKVTKATGKDWLNIIKSAKGGVSKEELKVLDVYGTGFPKSDQVFTKDEVLDRIKYNNKIMTPFVTKFSGDFKADWEQLGENTFRTFYHLPGTSSRKEWLIRPSQHTKGYEILQQGFHPIYAESLEQAKRAVEADIRSSIGDTKTRWKAYKVPGGKDYSEMILSLPGSHKFGHYHWRDISNPISSIRYDMRDVGGEKTLFINELQSDWAQIGRRKGFKVPINEMPEPNIPIERLIRKGTVQIDYNDVIYNIDKIDGIFEIYASGGLREQFKSVDEVKDYIKAHSQLNKGLVQPMPFKKTEDWVDLSLAHILQEAIDKGATRIAIANPEEQYRLYGSELIEWRPDNYKLYSVFDPYSKRTFKMEAENIKDLYRKLKKDYYNNPEMRALDIEELPSNLMKKEVYRIYDWNNNKSGKEYYNTFEEAVEAHKNLIKEKSEELNKIVEDINIPTNDLIRLHTELSDLKNSTIRLDRITEKADKPGIRVRAIKQYLGQAPAGGDLGELATQRGLNFDQEVVIRSENDLTRILENVLEYPEDAPSRAKKIWKKIQENPTGTSLPRKEGMEEFYGKIVPSRLKETARKLGIKAELDVVDIDTGNRTDIIGYYDPDTGELIGRGSPGSVDQPKEVTKWMQENKSKFPKIKLISKPSPSLSIKITPELKESYLKKGLPLLGVGAVGIGISGSMQEKEEKEEKKKENPFDRLFD